MLIPSKLLRTNASATTSAGNTARAGHVTIEPDPVALRSSGRPQDRELSALAVAWTSKLPPGLSPKYLLECYPRVANRLALCWSDAALARRVLDDLLIDKRGGRKGFPSPVQAELVRLRNSCPEALEVESSTAFWELHAQAPSDR